MRIGVKLPLTVGMPGEYLADARAYEAAGADSLWLSDGMIRPAQGVTRYPAMPDPWTVLAAVAGATDRVRLGTSVAAVALWPPALFAVTINTLEQLSRGRVIVGAGAGWERAQWEAAGLDFESRGRRLDEFVAALRHLWADSRQPFEGEFYRLPGMVIPAGVREGGPPVFFGSFSEVGYRRAARSGDGFIAGGGGPDAVKAVFDRVLEHRAGSGREGDFELWVQVGMPDSRAAWAESLAAYGEAGATGVIVGHDPRLLDLLRNPDIVEDRSDLNLAQG